MKGSAHEAESALGPAFVRLPWRGPEGARRHLAPRRKRALREAEALLERAWQRARSGEAVLHALQAIVPSEVAIATSGLGVGGDFWAVSMDPDGSIVDDMPRSVDKAAHASLKRFDATPNRPYANRPSNLAALTVLEDSVDSSLEVFESIWPSGEVGDQMRAFLFDEDGVYRGYFGFARRGRGRFGEQEHAVMHALQPALCDWSKHAHALGLHPCRTASLPVTTLDTFPDRALILHGDRVVFANEAARATSAELPRGADARAAARSTSRFRVADGTVYELVVLPPPPPRAAHLTPALREIAQLLAEGLSDKEIATATGRTLATVRTYVKRVFQALGVHSRRELMRGGHEP